MPFPARPRAAKWGVRPVPGRTVGTPLPPARAFPRAAHRPSCPAPPPPTGGNEPPPPPPPVVTPQVVPEPATITSGVLGLAMVAGWALRRGRKAGGDAEAGK